MEKWGRIMAKELIRLKDCVVTYDDNVVLDHINLYINDKEFLTLLGPSGCGKTTTLRIIGGFLTPTSGEVTFDGQRINDVPPYKRQINTVFQRYALFPRGRAPADHAHEPYSHQGQKPARLGGWYYH